MLIGIAVFNIAAQTCLNRSFALADASFVLPFDFLRLPLVVLAGVFLFSEMVDAWAIIGATVIFGATCYATRYESQQHGTTVSP